MSRHRNVRSLALDDYDDDDDDYSQGYSYEDESYLTGSPSTAHYLYSRDRAASADRRWLGGAIDQQLAQDPLPPPAVAPAAPAAAPAPFGPSAPDYTVLAAGIESVNSVVGDSFSDAEIVRALRGHEYNVERAIASLLDGDAVDPAPASALGQALADKEQPQKKTPSMGKKTLVVSGSGKGGFKFDTPSPDQRVIQSREKTYATPVAESKAGTGTGGGAAAASSSSSSSAATEAAAASTPSSTASPATNTNVAQRPASKTREILKQLGAAREKAKPHISMVICGHVDAGKSTLMGHLLTIVGHVSEKQMRKFQRDAQTAGKASFAFAWVLDEQEEERKRGITMDVGMTTFETPHRKITLLDAPGHREYVPNMISGAAQADVAVLVVDATRGEFEAGFDNDGQTKEHAVLIRSLGVTQLVVAVNKMDNADWAQERFEEIKAKMAPFLASSGFKDQNVTYLPCSGFTGVNLETCAQPELEAWYKGPALLGLMDQFKVADRDVDRPFRLCLSTVSDKRMEGKIETGVLAAGDKVLVMPLAQVATVKSLERSGDGSVKWAAAGDNVSVNLTGPDLSAVTTGNMLCSPEAPIRLVSVFEAQILVFQLPKPILPGTSAMLYMQHATDSCRITGLVALTDRRTGEVTKKKPRFVRSESAAVVRITVQRPIPIELYAEYRAMGRFMLRDGARTIATGVVTKIVE